MKTFITTVLCALLPFILMAQDSKPTAESKAAAERAFDAVISVDNEQPTNEEINDGLADALDDLIDNLDELKDAKKIKALREMKKHIEDNSDGEPTTVLDKAAKAAKKAVKSGDKIEDAGIDDYIDKVKSGLAKAAIGLFASFEQNAMPQLGDHYSIAARGTGQTTGHIADLSITNTSDDVLVTQPQLFYIPSRVQDTRVMLEEHQVATVINPGTNGNRACRWDTVPHVSKSPITNGAPVRTGINVIHRTWVPGSIAASMVPGRNSV